MKKITNSIEGKSRKIYINFAVLALLLIVVSVMLSSFVMRVIVSPPVESKLIEKTQKEIVEKTIQINVLNGCGVQGIAKKVKEYLRMRGFDVVETANYPEDVEKSFVIDRMRDSLSSQKVAYALGIDRSKVKTKVDSSLFIRCTVVIGSDYKNLKFGKN